MEGASEARKRRSVIRATSCPVSNAEQRLANRPGAFCFSDARVAASACQEFVTRKLGELTCAWPAEQNAEYQGLQRDLASGSRPADRRSARHRHRQGCHQEIQQPRDMVMARPAVTALSKLPITRGPSDVAAMCHRARIAYFPRDRAPRASNVAFRDPASSLSHISPIISLGR